MPSSPCSRGCRATFSGKGEAKVKMRKCKAFHSWRKLFEIWRCEACWRTERASTKEGDLPMTGCAAVPPLVRACRKAPHGHLHALADSSRGPFVICLRCGAYAWKRARKLKQPCEGKHPQSEVNLKQLQAGKFPGRFPGEAWLGSFPVKGEPAPRRTRIRGKQPHDARAAAGENIRESERVKELAARIKARLRAN